MNNIKKGSLVRCIVTHQIFRVTDVVTRGVYDYSSRPRKQIGSETFIHIEGGFSARRLNELVVLA